jgi:hypothetical protein
MLTKPQQQERQHNMVIFRGDYVRQKSTKEWYQVARIVDNDTIQVETNRITTRHLAYAQILDANEDVDQVMSWLEFEEAHLERI